MMPPEPPAPKLGLPVRPARTRHRRLLGKDPLEIDLDVARRGGMEAQQLRAAANAPIQGSRADIIKVAMVQLQDALQRQGLPTQLLLQVHDELVLVISEINI